MTELKQNFRSERDLWHYLIQLPQFTSQETEALELKWRIWSGTNRIGAWAPDLESSPLSLYQHLIEDFTWAPSSKRFGNIGFGKVKLMSFYQLLVCGVCVGPFKEQEIAKQSFPKLFGTPFFHYTHQRSLVKNIFLGIAATEHYISSMVKIQ